MKKLVINALQYKEKSSGIGVMIRDLFTPLTARTTRECEVILPANGPEFLCTSTNVKTVRIPWKHGDTLKRVFFQTFSLGRKHCQDAVLLVTDSKSPFMLPKSCTLVPVVTDMAVYRMPKVYKLSRVLWWRLQYAYVKNRADYFIAISEFTKRELVDIFNISEEKVKVIPCACSASLKKEDDEEAICAVRNKYKLPPKYILFMGNSNPRKNLENIMLAFDKAKAEHNIPHKLIIAGGQGWKFDENAAKAKVKAKEDVLFIGFVDDEDKAAIYSGADLFVFTTLYEGFGIPILEAQACGTPVLTSSISAMPEVAGNGAIYADPHDIEDMAQKMVSVIKDEEKAEELIRCGYENVKRFSWDTSAEQLAATIEQIVQH